jgi:hypothetical protein
LKLSHIAVITGYSKSTVRKVLYNEKSRERFKKETVEKIFKWRDYQKSLEPLFEGALFQKMCETVVRKVRKSHTKNYENVLDLAISCRFLAPANRSSFFSRQLASAVDIISDVDFPELCDFARVHSNCYKVRILADDLAMQSRFIIWKLGSRNKKQKTKGAIN